MTFAALCGQVSAALSTPGHAAWGTTLIAGLILLAQGAAGAQETGFDVRPGAAPLVALLDPSHGAWDDAVAITWGPAPYPTEFRALHTADGLALRFHAVDDAPWHTLTERDEPIWTEEVVEIFIDPDGDGHNYVEIEINPANVLCDLQVFATAPRLISDIDWNFAGVETRVSRVDDGWIATAILPWDGFATLRDTAVRLPPTAGDAWSFNVFRIKRPGGPADPKRDAQFAPWSPTPSLSFHAPSAFRPLRFVE